MGKLTPEVKGRDPLTERIIKCCFDVHNALGPGFIVEIKSLAGATPTLFHSQVFSYLKASRLHTGLLINFGNKSCQVKRFAL